MKIALACWNDRETGRAILVYADPRDEFYEATDLFWQSTGPLPRTELTVRDGKIVRVGEGVVVDAEALNNALAWCVAAQRVATECGVHVGTPPMANKLAETIAALEAALKEIGR